MIPPISMLTNVYRVISPDMAGNGDSTPLAKAEPGIADYAARLLPLLDTLGIDTIHVYGSQTGASIAAELTILAPDRVRKLILDGGGVFTPEECDAHLAGYTHPFPPDLVYRAAFGWDAEARLALVEHRR